MKFSTEAMESVKNDFQTIIADIIRTLDNIENTYQNLAQSGSWVGSGASYYLNKFKNIINSFNTVEFELQNTTRYLESVIADYSSLDKKIIMAASDIFKIG